MAEIRAFWPSDLDDLYRICLATGAGGDDASGLYRDPKLIGHVYAAPYANLSPPTVFVVEDADGVGQSACHPVLPRLWLSRAGTPVEAGTGRPMVRH